MSQRDAAVAREIMRGAGTCLRLLGLALQAISCASVPPLPTRAGDGAADSQQPRVVWPRANGEADAAGSVVLLEAPRADSSARRLVRDFFDAVRRESLRELGATLTEDATISSGPGTAPESVTKVWAARFKRLDYAFSGAKYPYRSDELGLFTADELLRLRPIRRFELLPESGELLAVVITRDRRKIVGPRHFGRRIELVLGPTPAGLRISRMFEDFRLP
jgi:hypothetical protein